MSKDNPIFQLSQSLDIIARHERGEDVSNESQKQLEEVLGMVEYDLEEGHQISWGHAKFMFDEIKRLQPIESSYNRYKRALRKIVCLNVPIPDEVFNLANDALEGVDTQ